MGRTSPWRDGRMRRLGSARKATQCFALGLMLAVILIPWPWLKLAAFTIRLYGTREAGGVFLSVHPGLYVVKESPSTNAGPAYKDMFTFESLDIRNGWSRVERVEATVYLVDMEVFLALSDRCPGPSFKESWGDVCEIRAPRKAARLGEHDDFGLYSATPANVILLARDKEALRGIHELNRTGRE